MLLRSTLRSMLTVVAAMGMALGAASARAQTVPTCNPADVGPVALRCAGYEAGNTDTPAGTSFIDGVLTSWGFTTLTDAAGYTEVKSDDSDSDGFTFAGNVVEFGQTLYGDVVVALKFGAGGRGQQTGFALYHLNGGEQGLSSFTFSNPGLGGLSHVSQWGGSPVHAVPEPETYALMLVGLIAVAVGSRRRKPAQSPATAA